MDQITTAAPEPFPIGTDYFTALGLPRLMHVDARAMETSFHDLSRRFHPDRFATADIKTRRVSLENSALVNKAYKTLKDPWERAKYLVQLEQGQGTEIAAQPPHDLFEEILELQEILIELRMAVMEGEATDGMKSEAETLAAPFRAAFENTETRLRELFDAWDAVTLNPQMSAPREIILTQLKELLGERRYLLRVNADIDSAFEGKPAPRDL